MPTEVQSVATGIDFDGLSDSTGQFKLSQLKAGDDTQRPELFSVSVQSTVVMDSIVVRAAQTVGNATGTGIEFIELLNEVNVAGVQKTCCRCILPNDWSVFVITTGTAAAAKTALVDWQGVTKRPLV
jgi:hypothetical protein